MMKTYSYAKDKNKKVSEHFSVYEFASTSNSPYNPTKIWTDKVLVYTELIDELEKLYTLLNAKECRISSGNRTVQHDRQVGGSGKGAHVDGKAIDCCWIGQDGKIIDTRIISCIAQGLAFNGIARISNNYIHLDMGNRLRRYMGDETKSYNTVTTDFYKYYRLTKDEVNKYIKNPIVSNTTSSSSSLPEISYQVYTNKWLPLVTNSDLNSVKDWAGIERKPIHAFRIFASDGTNIKYNIHIKEVNSWLPNWIESKTDKGDFKTFAGTIDQNLTIDAIKIVVDDKDYDIYYRVSDIMKTSYYSYVKNDTDYAGKFGLSIDKVQVYLKKK